MQCSQTHIHQKISGKHTHTHIHTWMQKGNLGADLLSTAQLDKGDYPHCGELGPRFSVCAFVCVCVLCVCVYTLVFFCECTHALCVCLLLMFLRTKCVGVCARVCVLSCVTALRATEMRNYLDFPSGIFSRVAEKYY